jgi:YHS domain-containing protein
LTPLRLIIIGILIFLLFRLLTGPKRRLKKAGKSSRHNEAGKEVVQDVLVEDPVCHTHIPKGQAVQLHHDKNMYYFCSNKCCEMFLKQKGAEQ